MDLLTLSVSMESASTEDILELSLLIANRFLLKFDFRSKFESSPVGSAKIGDGVGSILKLSMNSCLVVGSGNKTAKLILLQPNSCTIMA